METLQRTANRGSVSTGYDIDNSLKLEADNDERLSITPGSAGDRRTWTFSAWIKRTELGAKQTLFSAGDTYLYFEDDDTIWCNFRAASENFFLATNRLFRDTSAWYHIVLQCDTTDGTAADRAKLYINGIQETSFSNSTYDNMAEDYQTSMNNTGSHVIGRYSSADENRMSGYIAEFHHVDGTALAPTAFGKFDSDTGIWKPISPSVTYGTNGFYLDFADSGDLGDDESGNGNDFAETNIAAADQATDSPTNNFCTLSTLWQYAANTGISEGATKSDGSGAWAGMKATIGISSGKWYWEYKPTSGTYLDLLVGVQTDGDGNIASGNAHNILDTAAFHLDSGTLWIKDSTSGRTDTTYGNVSNSETETYAVALNMDDNQINFYINNTLLTVANQSIDGLSGKVCFPLAAVYNVGVSFNFGGYTTISISSAAADANGYGTFEYAPPTGYYALCTKNLSEFGG